MRKTKRNLACKGKNKLKKTTCKRSEKNDRNRNLTARKKINRKRKSFKKKSLKQKGGNLEIILPAIGVALAGATIGVYISKKMSNKNNNNTFLNQNGNNATNEKEAQIIKAGGDWLNEHLIVNIMLDKIQEMYEKRQDISIETILLESEQTYEETFGTLYDLAIERGRTVSGYVGKYISHFLLAYFLYHFGEDPDTDFSVVFPSDLKEKFNDQLANIKKTNHAADAKKVIQMPNEDDINSIFKEAKNQITMIISFVKKYKGDIDIKEFVKNIEKEYIGRYTTRMMQNINNGHLNIVDLNTPENFYSKIINKYKKS